MDTLMLGWTTFASEQDAQKLGNQLVLKGLAACTQIDGPIRSTYLWKGQLCHDDEYRMTVKFAESQAEGVTRFIDKNHPYETPQWLTCRADFVAPHYLDWVLRLTKTQNPQTPGD